MRHKERTGGDGRVGCVMCIPMKYSTKKLKVCASQRCIVAHLMLLCRYYFVCKSFKTSFSVCNPPKPRDEKKKEKFNALIWRIYPAAPLPGRRGRVR